MYPITNEVKALFEAEQTKVLRITGTDKNGTAITITDDNVLVDSFQVDRYSCNGQKLEIGTAISAQMSFKLENNDGQYDSIIFEGTELFVEVGVADWTQENPTVHWVPCGYFTPDEQPRRMATISITALDRMMRFDAIPPTLTPWTTSSGEYMTDSQGNIIYFLSNVRFPCTVAALVQRVALLCSVPFTQNLTGLPNANLVIDQLPVLEQQITFRNIIQWCAGIMGTNAWIDWTGSLRFSWYNNATGYVSTIDNRYSSDLYENDLTVTGVGYTNNSNIFVVAGTDEYALDMSGNYMAAAKISTILSAVNGALNGFTYRPFVASAINAPYLWPMDAITFTDKDGNNHSSVLTNVTFGLNGTTALQSKGETAETNSRVKPSGVNSETAQMIERAVQVARDLDKSLTQEEIFNRLTDNGETQGLLLYDGKVYLNAEYIQAGTLVTNLLLAAILTIGGANNGNGSIRILDENGNAIGTWDKNGLTCNKGSINLNNGVFNVTNAGAVTASNASLKGAFQTTGTDIWDNTINTRIASGKIRMFGSTDIDGDVPSWQPHAYLYIRALGGSSPETSIGAFVSDFEIYCAGYLDQHAGTLTLTASGGDYDHSNERGNVTIKAADICFMDNSSSSTPLVKCIGSTLYGGGSRYVDFNVPVNVYSSFTVASGYTKSKAVTTDQYAERLLYCYETPSPLFGDVGEAVIGEDGLCYVTIDPIFAQTITTDNYQVFLQRYGAGDCYVQERKGGWFVVAGTPGLAFGWEIKGKQADIADVGLRRLDKHDEKFTVPTQTYGEDAANHIDDIRKEREAA